MPPARRPHRARPALVTALQHYDRKKALADLIAGVTVGLVALPLALAFAISSGLPPQAGIYTAVVAGGLISLLGGSRLQIGGPTGAFVVIVAGIVSEHGVEGLFVCTLMAGGMLVAAWRHRNGIRGALHPAARCRGLHQRHRGAHRQHADSRFPGPARSSDCRATFCPA